MKKRKDDLMVVDYIMDITKCSVMKTLVQEEDTPEAEAEFLQENQAESA